jgi:hypothetical protein
MTFGDWFEDYERDGGELMLYNAIDLEAAFDAGVLLGQCQPVMKWVDAQKRAPKDFQMCLVVGEPKTRHSISCFVTIYSERNETFMNTSMHRISVPRAKARWWTPIQTVGKIHPMDSPVANVEVTP